MCRLALFLSPPPRRTPIPSCGRGGRQARGRPCCRVFIKERLLAALKNRLFPIMATSPKGKIHI